MGLGDICERVIWPQKGHDPQDENLWSRFLNAFFSNYFKLLKVFRIQFIYY